MDPVSIPAATGLVLKGLELVHKLRQGKLKGKEANELYGRIFASLLWEVLNNLKRCSNIVKMSEENRISAGILSFLVRDSLFFNFCVMCPEPSVVSKMNEIYSAMERIHHWQRITPNINDAGGRYIIGFARDLFEKKRLDETYNYLRALLSELQVEIEIPPKFVRK